MGLAAETGIGVCRACWTYMSLVLLTGKGCLLSVLDYLGPTVEIGLGVCWACWTVWVGLVNRQKVSAERVGLFGSNC